MALLVGRFSSLLVLLVVGMLPSTTCQSTSHADEHDHEHTVVTTTVDSHAGHDHDDDHKDEHTDAMNKTDGKDAGHDDHDHEKEHIVVTTTVDSHAGHDHDDHKDEHTDAMNKTDGNDVSVTAVSATPAQKNVISGDFEVAVAEDQEDKLKDAIVIVAFQKAYALFVNVPDTAVTVTWAAEEDHTGHDHARRLRSLQATVHHQVGHYVIKTDGLSNSAVQTAVDKLKRVKTSTSTANELKTKMNSRIQAVPGMTSLVVQKVLAHKDPVLQQETTLTTPTEQNTDFAKQTSCPWTHYSWLLVALFMKALI